MPERIQPQHAEPELGPLSRHGHVEAMGADAVHAAGVGHQDRGALRVHLRLRRAHEDTEERVGVAEDERLLGHAELGLLRAREPRTEKLRSSGRACDRRTRGALGPRMPLGEPAGDGLHCRRRELRAVVDLHEEVLSGDVAVIDLSAELPEVVEELVLLRHVARADDQRALRRALRDRQEVDRLEVFHRLRRQEEPERLLPSPVPPLRLGGEALGLEHLVHLVELRGLRHVGGAAHVRVPQHQLVDLALRRARRHGYRRAEAKAHDGHLRHLAARPQLLHGVTHVGQPGFATRRVELRARGVAGAVEVEAEHPEARRLERLGEVPERAVRPHEVIADRIAQNDAGASRCAERRVQPSEERARLGAEVKRSGGECTIGHGGLLGSRSIRARAEATTGRIGWVRVRA